MEILKTKLYDNNNSLRNSLGNINSKFFLPLIIIYWKQIICFLGFILCFLIFIIYLNIQNSNEQINKKEKIETYLDNSQISETAGYPFDFSTEWYSDHNVSNATMCHIGGTCTPAKWAKAVYNKENDTRGKILYEKAIAIKNEQDFKFPKGLCVTEYNTKICELGYGDEMTKNIGSQTFAIKGNKYICYDSGPNQFLTYNTNGENPLKIKPTDFVFCVSDFGQISTNKNTYVNKHWGEIFKDEARYGVSGKYYVSSQYINCLWTYEDGSGSIPYVDISNNYDGPYSEASNVKAFCLNGNNQVNIYTYK